ncbi:hypothetical protein [Mycoplasma sp. 3686d]|uniref:hypothetical protein n=1 Tax=Mycoplasma sp. 3686d TaxID=2967300 RepID=UPI00211C9103|nr:hypothetical protein [Mycoplasma sp. 3686d]UUM24529.1 hypothetical protein NPA12_02405 [Mycoplasma sp. 3686d]
MAKTFVITDDIKPTFEMLERDFKFDTKAFVKKINEYIKTLYKDDCDDYLDILRDSFKYKSEYDDKSINLSKENLYWFVKILFLNPDIFLLWEVFYIFVKNQFEFECDGTCWLDCSCQPIHNYTEYYFSSNKIYTGEEWWNVLESYITSRGIKTPHIELIKKYKELKKRKYYKFKDGVFLPLSHKQIVNFMLTSIWQVLKANKGENFLVLDNNGQKNLKYLQDKGVNTDELIDKFIKLVQNLKENDDRLYYLTKVNQLLNSNKYNKQILDILNTHQSYEIIDDLYSILNDDQWTIEEFVDKIVKKDSDYRILNGLDIIEYWKKDLEKYKIRSKFVSDYQIIKINEIQATKLYWVDENIYPKSLISQEELILEILNNLSLN